MTTTPWATLAAALTRVNDRIDAMPSIREATVYSEDPLTVRFDTDTEDTYVKGSLVARAFAGTRVLTLKLKHYVWILGVKGGADASVLIDDWDNALADGLYYAQAGAANAPITDFPTVGTVRRVHTGPYAGRITQELSAPLWGSRRALADGRWVRVRRDAGSGWAWDPWRQTIPLTGTVTFSGSGGNVRTTQEVSFPTGFFTDDPWVVIAGDIASSGAIIGGSSVNATPAGFTAIAAAASGNAFSGTYVLKWTAQQPEP